MEKKNFYDDYETYNVIDLIFKKIRKKKGEHWD